MTRVKVDYRGAMLQPGCTVARRVSGETLEVLGEAYVDTCDDDSEMLFVPVRDHAGTTRHVPVASLDPATICGPKGGDDGAPAA